ncbi:MAG: haloacid dehalogenase-like hydrolase [Candidatus Njordarchaeia archaeon]
MPRIVDAPWSVIRKMTSREILEGIKKSEGRIIAAEVVVPTESLVDGVSNVEIAASFGADIIILNFYDAYEKKINGIPESIKSIRELRDFLGRLIGVNLEPVKPEIAKQLGYTPGRLATPESAQRLVEDGVDLLILTANPKTNVTLEDLVQATREIRENIGDKAIIISGKMHLAGKYKEAITLDIVKKFKSAGADGVLMPAPGTVPGIDLEFGKKFVKMAHEHDLIVESCIGTSQEGADLETIRRIAILGKMTGADIHHIGDSGFRPGVPIPENVMAYSIAIRGKRHTYRRIAASILR